MRQYQKEYNRLLKQWENGCEYLKVQKDKQKEGLPKLIKIVNELNEIIKNYDVPKTYILKGFPDE